jgi:hypothetical protein
MRALSFAVTLLLSASVAADCLTPQWEEVLQNVSAYDLREHALADFNSDGQPDIVAIARTSSSQPATKVVLIASPFTSERLIATGANLRAIAAFDVTGDGKADVVLTDSTDKTLIVLPGKGNGTFATAVVTHVPDAPAKFAIADFFRDGHPDLAALTTSPSVVTIYAGAGDGAFVGITQETIPASPASISAGDLDADGLDDLMIGHSDSANVSVLFGNGDGSVGGGISVPAKKWAAGTVAVDLDGDGDRELVATNYDTSSITVNINNGHRTFRAPVSYSAAGLNPSSFAVADFNGDHRSDLAVGMLNGERLVEYTSKGDGTLRSGYPAECADCHLFTLAATDYNHDGRVDVIAVTGFGVSLFLNQCGSSRIAFSTTTPTISAGQPLSLTAGISGPFDASTIHPTGTIAIRDGAATIKTIPAAEHADVTIDNLAVGDHTLTARYEGDAEYEPTTSPAVVVHVVAQTTAVTLTQTKDHTSLGEEVTFDVLVASDGTPVTTGTVRLLIDGSVKRSASAPGFTESVKLAAGDHTIIGEYAGDTAHAPSNRSITHTVARSAPFVDVTPAGNLLNIVVEGVPSFVPTGVVRLLEGTTAVGTATLNAGNAVLSASALAPGEHSLRVSYVGDTNYIPAASPTFVYTVVQPTRRRSARH